MFEPLSSQTSVIPVPVMSKALSRTIRILTATLALSWFLYVIQFFGFLLLGFGGFLISSFIQLSMVQLWQPLVAIVLILLVIIGWRKVPAPKWVLFFAVYTLFAGFLSFLPIPFSEYVIEALGFIFSFITLHQVKKIYVKEFGRLTFSEGFLNATLLCILVVFLIFFGDWVRINSFRKYDQNARELQKVINTPSNQLNSDQLSKKNNALDRDLNIRMSNIHFQVFEPYFRVNRASDGHRTYTGMCNSEQLRPTMEIIRRDSPQEPVCRDADVEAIIYASNSQGAILCVDVDNENPVTLTNSPVGLKCK